MRAAISPADGLRGGAPFATGAAMAGAGFATGLSGLAPRPVLVALARSFDFRGDFCLLAGGRVGLAAGCAFAAGLRAGVATARLPVGRLAAGVAFLAGVFPPERFLAAALALPAAGDFRAGFACFLTMIILVPYGAARQGNTGAWTVPCAKTRRPNENGGGAKNLKL